MTLLQYFFNYIFYKYTYTNTYKIHNNSSFIITYHNFIQHWRLKILEDNKRIQFYKYFLLYWISMKRIYIMEYLQCHSCEILKLSKSI